MKTRIYTSQKERWRGTKAAGAAWGKINGDGTERDLEIEGEIGLLQDSIGPVFFSPSDDIFLF